MSLKFSQILNAVLLAIILIMAYFIYTRKAEVVISDNSYIEAQKAKLKRENDSLAKNIIKLVFQASAYEQKIDSLETVKQKIKPHYDKVYKKIDRYSSSQLIHELDSAFASDTR